MNLQNSLSATATDYARGLSQTSLSERQVLGQKMIRIGKRMAVGAFVSGIAARAVSKAWPTYAIVALVACAAFATVAWELYHLGQNICSYKGRFPGTRVQATFRHITDNTIVLSKLARLLGTR